MSKITKPIGYSHDYHALESDCLITSIIYERTDVSKLLWRKLDARIQYLKKLLL